MQFSKEIGRALHADRSRLLASENGEPAVACGATLTVTGNRMESTLLDRELCYRALCARDARFDGRFFVAVRTTGIYCRPICPARTPKLENIAFYPSAAAAQDGGYRPCLRCRPESSPELAAWRGTSSTVSRAMMLIAEGALDGEGADVEALAQRLGVGGRQLRRLFQQHLGTSPIAVAQTRRLLFAKKLVHETALPMAQIASAAGFGSLRRYNDTFRRLYGRPPSELRRHRGRAQGASGATGAITLSLSYVPPYDWPAMQQFFAARAIPGVEIVENDRYARAFELDGSRGTISVTPSTKKDNALSLTIRFPAVSTLPAIVARVRRMFDLDADVRMIHATLRQDRLLARLVDARPGLRVPGAWDPFELLVRAILGQQVTVSAARGLAARLVATCGDALDMDARTDGLTHVFPRAAGIARADLSGLGIPRARMATLLACARVVAGDPRLFDPTRSVEETLAILHALPGIGEWTAQYVALRALRDPDAFPASDVGIRRGAAEDDVRPTAAAMLSRAEGWRPWRGYAAQYLWFRDACPRVTPVASTSTVDRWRPFVLAPSSDSAYRRSNG
jgi:AraC family transcriptional regulator, regulatory protein of adaptative response / DNA-3-methyladenine glycosylase II